MSEPVRIEEVGRNGRLVPSPQQLQAIVGAIETAIETNTLVTTSMSTAPLWRFSGRSWGNHPADRRSRPRHNSAY
jgi:hypothetical protein